MALLLRMFAASAVALASCSPPKAVDAPLTVTLPLSHMTVVDSRIAFAEVFERELSTSNSPTHADSWLTLPKGVHLRPVTDQPGALQYRISILIAPGIFGDCVASQPFSDGLNRPGTDNYVEGYRHYQSLGAVSIRAVQLRGRASSARNGDLLADAILEEQRRPDVGVILLVGYSKGLSDALHALAKLNSEQQFPSKLKALVSIVGVVSGTFLADQYASLYESLAASFNPLQCSAAEGGEVESLAKRVRLPWLERHELPTSVSLYSVVARTNEDEVAPGLLPSFRKLTQLGSQNDGQLLESDAILPRSLLLAEVLSDHWKFVLPLEGHPSQLVRALVNDKYFPRDEFFRALVRFVLTDISAREMTPLKGASRPR